MFPQPVLGSSRNYKCEATYQSNSSFGSDSSKEGADVDQTRSSTLKLQKTANYDVHETYQVDTIEHADHTFSGIMFNVVAKAVLPIEYLRINSIWLKGSLGNMGIWYTSGGYNGKECIPQEWEQVFQGFRAPSWEYLEIRLDKPIVVCRGERVGIYAHSTRGDDTAIVYDDERSAVTHEDTFIKIESGCAHVSDVPFSETAPYGWAWRPRREFVGKISHGVRFSLWRPIQQLHKTFPEKFRIAAKTLLMCSRKQECQLSVLPQSVIYLILNMCRWDWFGALNDDEQTTIKTSKERSNETGAGIGWRSLSYSLAIHEHREQCLSGRFFSGSRSGMDGLGDESSEDSEWVEQSDDMESSSD